MTMLPHSLVALIVAAIVVQAASQQPHYYEDSVAAESSAAGSSSAAVDAIDELATGSYVLPKQIFNDGKPFFLEKNPVSGALDFNGKKTLGYSSPNAIVDPDAAAGGQLSTGTLWIVLDNNVFANEL